jgi:predicted flap endonuclease-1-like 5' DNA nuclease
MNKPWKEKRKMAKIIDVEGIGPQYAEKLSSAGIGTTDDLLEHCKSAKGRRDVAESTGISEKLVLRWTNQADLFRIKGIGEEYADLLEAAGVDTVPELSQRNAANLCAKMSEVNEEKKLTRQPPSEKQVSDWIEQAKSLPRVIDY